MLAFLKRYKLWAWVVIGVCLVTMLVLAYLHYTNMVDRLASLSETVGKVEEDLAREKLTVQTLRVTVRAWGNASDLQAQALEDLSLRQEQSSKYLREVQDVLSKHNLKNLASKKPGLVERAVNDGTARTFRLLEQSTSPSSVRTDSSTSSPSSSGATSR